MKYIACTSCNYLYSLNNDYIYSNDEGSIKYNPQINVGWCLECNDFRDIQIGIKVDDIRDKKKLCEKELGSLKKKIIKFPSIKHRIKFLENEILEYDFLIYILNNKDSYCSCTKCGSTNIIFKDIDNSIWAHRKCIGHFVFKDINEDIRFRIEPIRIFPVTRRKSINILELILRCSIDMFDNHNVAMYQYKLFNYIPIIEDGIYYLYIRQAFVIANLRIDKKIVIDDIFIRNMYNYMGDINNISFDEYKSYINKAIAFFDTEIYLSKVGEYFIPTKICYPFIYPKTEDLSHELNHHVIDIMDSFPIWNVVQYTYFAYFSNQ